MIIALVVSTADNDLQPQSEMVLLHDEHILDPLQLLYYRFKLTYLLTLLFT